jgi:hypothetical protein
MIDGDRNKLIDPKLFSLLGVPDIYTMSMGYIGI